MVRTDPAFDLQIRKVRNVAKSTKGKSKAAQEPVTVDETAQAASGAGVEDVTQPIVEDAEIVSDEALVTLEDDASEIDTETPDAEFAEESEASEPAQQEPAVVRETVVEQQSVFLPLLFGGFVAAGIGALGACDWIVTAGRFQHRSEYGRFRQVYVARRFSEELQCRFVNSSGAGTKIYTVHIKLQNFVLGEFAFQPDRQNGFLHLSFQCALRFEKQVLGQLLCYRGAALNSGSGSVIGIQRTRNTKRINTEM